MKFLKMLPCFTNPDLSRVLNPVGFPSFHTYLRRLNANPSWLLHIYIDLKERRRRTARMQFLDARDDVVLPFLPWWELVIPNCTLMMNNASTIHRLKSLLLSLSLSVSLVASVIEICSKERPNPHITHQHPTPKTYKTSSRFVADRQIIITQSK